MLPEPVVQEPRRRSGLLIALVALVITAGVLLALWVTREPETQPVIQQDVSLDPDAMAPEGVRIRVRIVNTTNVRGLARRATNLVRDLGYDVVDYDSDLKLNLDSTAVVVHTGHTDWGDRLARGVNAAIVRSAPDSLRYLDLTLLIGRDWKPPAQPFRP